MSTPITHDDLLKRLEAGETFILPTPRAATQLRAAYDARQRAANISAWTPPSLLAWTQWAQTLWSGLILDGAEPRLLLNPAQEHLLWRDIVAEDTADALGSPDTLAQLASSAWKLAAQHQALPRLRATANTHDSRIFAQWAEAFTRRCTQRNYLSTALLELTLQQHIEMGTLTPPRTLNLTGFLDRTPAQQSLLSTLSARGTRLNEITLTNTNPNPNHAQTSTQTEPEELDFAARWARTRLEANPAANLAILVPDLDKVRPQLEQSLRESLAPELHSIHTDLSATPWEFSSGPPLATLPILADALRLAHWAAHALSLDAVTALLLSPYIAHNATEPERSAGARFDATILRQATLLRDEIRLPWLLNLAHQQAQRIGQPKPLILSALADLNATLQRNDLQRPRTYADWTEFLRDLTRAMQWPGIRDLNPLELEATRAWDTLLDTLATLDFTGRRIPYTTFLAELDRQAAATPFHPPPTHAPLQILSPTESIGCTFDAVLFLRATDANFPAPEHIHPLLAWPLQRSLAMPGTDPTQSSARARLFTADLLHRAGNTLFTHAQEDTDGKLRPSSLLAALPHIAAEDLAPTPAPTEPIALEAFADTAPLPPLPNAEIHGGASVLKLQAACGFLAFAQLRLRSSELQTPELGLDALEAGNLLHHTLQIFWTRIKTQDDLRRLSTTDRATHLSECIDQAFPSRLYPETPWDTAYLALLKDRLIAILLPWLELELTRSPFEVRAIEAGQQIPIGPLTLDVRIDRLDRIPGHNGEPAGFVLVDYKTGLSGHPSDWETERPNDPQLPLYALLHQSEPGELKGLAFAKVRSGKDMKWHGIQAEADILPSPRSNHLVELPYLLNEWRLTLTHLAEDFAHGDARVRPRDFHIDCARCAQRLLCRVDFAALNQSNPPTDTDVDSTEETDA